MRNTLPLCANAIDSSGFLDSVRVGIKVLSEEISKLLRRMKALYANSRSYLISIIPNKLSINNRKRKIFISLKNSLPLPLQEKLIQFRIAVLLKEAIDEALEVKSISNKLHHKTNTYPRNTISIYTHYFQETTCPV